MLVDKHDLLQSFIEFKYIVVLYFWVQKLRITDLLGFFAVHFWFFLPGRPCSTGKCDPKLRLQLLLLRNSQPKMFNDPYQLAQKELVCSPKTDVISLRNTHVYIIFNIRIFAMYASPLEQILEIFDLWGRKRGKMKKKKLVFKMLAHQGKVIYG